MNAVGAVRSPLTWNRLLQPQIRACNRGQEVVRLQRRHFLPNPFESLSSLAGGNATPKQTLEASRTLPYPSTSIYKIIADVDSYSAFLPFCTRSTVTKWSAPDKIEGKRWPSEAQLVVGWQGVQETFTSRVFCIPGRVVEAVSGSTETTLPRPEVAHHFSDGQAVKGVDAESGVLSHLLTRWTVSAAEEDVEQATDVHLAIEYQFANPLYSAMSGAVADKVAGYMIEAFEARVKELLGANRGT